MVAPRWPPPVAPWVLYSNPLVVFLHCVFVNTLVAPLQCGSYAFESLSALFEKL